MLLKWHGRFADEDSSLWKKVVAANMGSRVTRKLNVTDHRMGVGPWKHTSILWEEFSQNITFEIRNGQHVKFWKDK